MEFYRAQRKYKSIEVDGFAAHLCWKGIFRHTSDRPSTNQQHQTAIALNLNQTAIAPNLIIKRLPKISILPSPIILPYFVWNKYCISINTILRHTFRLNRWKNHQPLRRSARYIYISFN